MAILFFKKFQERVSRFIQRGSSFLQLFRVLVLTTVFNLLFGMLFYLAERDVQTGLTLGDSIWWAMVTMTTVGYGDYSAQTFAGRYLISYPCMLLGIGIVGSLVGIFAERILEAASRKRSGLMKIKSKNHILICNYPGPAKVLQVVEELRGNLKYRKSDFVLVTDAVGSIPEEIKQAKIQFVQGNPVDEDVLLRANIVACRGVFILAAQPELDSSDEKSFAIGSIVEQIKHTNEKKIHTVVELVSRKNYRFMERSNVDGIVFADGITSCLLVQEFLSPGIRATIHQILSNSVGSQFYIFDTRLDGHKVSEIQIAVLKHPANLQVIGILKGDEQILNPAKSVVIEKGDRLIMLAESPHDFASIERDILSEVA